ncbi:hypothetical protein mRhiFer1_010188 [Rhinolophus ferrumequinum]|uniref:Uncharacterized protein n=1 Tax=Rhinolophus ferrumequinum TaxID=59479 RepID=A0A7J7XPW2_RHIFE|nr:hypothetical protein mRhiFer1_010188 [Rhinolophus ferrumequinum]
MPPTDDDMDPCVTQEMVNIGFQIEDALKKKTYNKVTATYLMLNAKQPKVQCCKILIRPFHSCDLNSSCPSPAQAVEPERSGLRQAEQQLKDQESGQKVVESAGLSASPKSRNATPGPSPRWRTPTPGGSPRWRTPTPRLSRRLLPTPAQSRSQNRELPLLPQARAEECHS